MLDLRQHPHEQICWREAGLVAARRLRQRNKEVAHLGNLGSAYEQNENPNAEKVRKQLAELAEEGQQKTVAILEVIHFPGMYAKSLLTEDVHAQFT